MTYTNLSEQDARELLSAKNATSPADFQQNYFVEAGAGAGKTTLIVERILAQLLSGFCKPEELVAITFTVKSTQELQKRLDEALLQRRNDPNTPPGQWDLLDSLRKNLGNMQISTIHSFCTKMIQTMPFHADLRDVGFEELPNEWEVTSEFLRQKQRENPQRFLPLSELFLEKRYYQSFFSTICSSGDANLVYSPSNSQEIKTAYQNLLGHGQIVHNIFHDLFTNPNTKFVSQKIPSSTLQSQFRYLHPVMLDFIQEQNPSPELLLQGMCYLFLNGGSPLKSYGPGIETLKTSVKKSLASIDSKQFDKTPILYHLRAIREHYEVKKPTKSNPTPPPPILRCYEEDLSTYLHSLLVETLEPVAQEYLLEKKEQRLVTKDDLLRIARTMLKTSPEAREYFHRRYPVLYVDEFQDTDPVQTELLFYLTAELAPGQTLPSNWQDCSPKAGSLFLVGDPKQAIYRFRGADISNYKAVHQIFDQDTTGKDFVISLKNNYRSHKNILDFVDLSFDPNHSHNRGKKFPKLMQSSPYQASFQNMMPSPNFTAGGGVRPYVLTGKNMTKCKEMDPSFVANMIKDLYDKKLQVGKEKNNTRDVEYRDFMVLCNAKKNVQDYVFALDRLGIPSISSGEQKLQDTPAILKGLMHMAVLAYPANSNLLALLLQEVYGFPLFVLRHYVALSDTTLEKGLFDPKKREQVLKSLEKGAVDEELARLTVVGKVLGDMKERHKTQSAMSVIEWIFDGPCLVRLGLNQQGIEEEHGRIQQFLNGLRENVKGTMLDYYLYGERLKTNPMEYQLLLHQSVNSVRVMNQHKAKGLEAPVVILTFYKPTDFPVTSHMERNAQGSHLHLCCYEKKKYLAMPPLWQDPTKGKEQVELDYLTAEKVRMNYVTCTRGENYLFLAQGVQSNWQEQNDRHLAEAAKNGITDGVLYEEPKKPTSTTSAATAPTTAPVTQQTPVTQASSPVGFDPQPKEQDLANMAEKSCSSKRISISPSKLDHSAPRKVPENEEVPEDSVPEETTLPEDESQAEEVVETATGEKVAETQATEEEHQPYGPQWGTMVHRILELWVETPGPMEVLAQQAILECFPSSTLSNTESKMLFGDKGFRLDEENSAFLLKKLLEAVSFTKNEDSSLCQMLKKGTAYPELSFFTAVDPGANPLYVHLKEHLQGAEEEEKSFDVQGFIDLAILTEDGWIVVDYKTDRFRFEESEKAYKQRLDEHYCNQISAYALLLTQATGEKVHACYLCSIPMEGEMISLKLP